MAKTIKVDEKGKIWSTDIEASQQDILTLIREQQILRETNQKLLSKITTLESKLTYLVRMKNLAYRMIGTLRYTSNSQNLTLSVTSKDLVTEYDKLRAENKKDQEKVV